MLRRRRGGTNPDLAALLYGTLQKEPLWQYAKRVHKT